MKSIVPISMTKFDTFDLLYFDFQRINNAERVESAYLLLEVSGNAKESEISCSLNKNVSFEIRDDYYIKQAGYNRNSYKKQISLDITEQYHLLASGFYYNNGLLINHGKHTVYSCQMYVIYSQQVILPRYWCMPFFEKELFVSSQENEGRSPFFMTAAASVVTFCVTNLGSYPVYLSVEYSPDTNKIVRDSQMIEVLPNETGIIIPMYFTKYVRVLITGSYPGVIANVWYQSQQK